MSIGDAFDAAVDYYDDWMRRALPGYDDLFATATSLIPYKSDRPIEVLDLRAGTGLFSKHVLDAFPNARFTLVDLAEKLLDVARQRFAARPAQFRYLTADYRTIEPSPQVDVVISSLSIHHLTDEEKQDLFRRVFRLVRDGGGFLNVDQIRGESPAIVHTLRQQMEKPPGRPNIALADFVAPRSIGAADYLGGFAVTAGVGSAELVADFEAAHDDYSAIMVKALADRLAEAFAERLHEMVRRELWGYAPDEALDNAALIAEAYQGIRPAPGYPACPDHTEKATLFELLDAEARAGIVLTASFAMLPPASVSGYYFWRPEAHYFGIGRIGRDQLEDYARRKGWSLDQAARWLAPNLDD